ncbi:MAG: 2-oxoacid:acceptor oxidoreductase family protein [Bacillota bacterium]|jgi:2-oxoglutarate ferredoxin oxidoreductase subunit gamma
MTEGLWRIALAGEGGQGVQVVGEVLAEAAYMDGKESIYIPNFGVEQRGGVSIAFVQISDRPIGSPKFAQADILVPLSQRAIDRTKRYIHPQTLYIYECSALEVPHLNEQAIGIQAWDTVAPEAFSLMVGHQPDQPGEPPSNTALRPGRTIGIPAAEIAKNELQPRVFNIIILGAIIGASKVLSEEVVQQAIERKLGAKFKQDPKLRKMNMAAFQRGLQLAQEQLQEGAKS